MTNPSPFTTSPVEVVYNTPLTIINIFVECLRERFTAGNSSPALSKWAWTNDDKTTKIFIESGFSINAEVRGKRPGIWVDISQNVYGNVSLGPFDQIAVLDRSRTEMYYSMADTDIMIACTSPNRGESMQLGSIAQEFLHMTSRPIMETFALRSMTPVIMTHTDYFDRERELWNTPVQFRVGYEVRWATRPQAVLLNNIRLRITDVNYGT
jgi:hypothetical protein